MITVKRYSEPPVNKREILRYAGADARSNALDETVESCLSELRGGLTCSVCYVELPVRVADGTVEMGSIRVRSADFEKYISGCERVIVFAATVGLTPDRLIKKYSRISPSRALIISAAGSERVESLCDAFCEDIRAEAAARGLSVRPRFSPGYGDLPLSLQKDVFALLDCERQLGVTLGDSLLMTPTKSVTAFVGERAD